MPTLTHRPAAPADAAAINRIYNHYITSSAITLDLTPWNLQRRADWLRQFSGGEHPYHALVAELDGEVVGFAANHRLRARAGYRLATETTIYIAPQQQRRGVGVALYKNLFQLIAQTELHRAFAAISLPNSSSMQFHRRFGFTQIGVFSEVGYKFDRHIDVAWLEKKLNESP